MGPVSISRLNFVDEASAVGAARLLRSNGIRVEALNKATGTAGAEFVVLIRSTDLSRASTVLDGDL